MKETLILVEIITLALAADAVFTLGCKFLSDWLGGHLDE
jgi:hypothetical protein